MKKLLLLTIVLLTSLTISCEKQSCIDAKNKLPGAKSEHQENLIEYSINPTAENKVKLNGSTKLLEGIERTIEQNCR